VNIEGIIRYMVINPYMGKQIQGQHHPKPEGDVEDGLGHNTDQLPGEAKKHSKAPGRFAKYVSHTDSGISVARTKDNGRRV
jgi:hypothetical protein